MRQTYQFILLLLTGIFFYSCQGDELSTSGKRRLLACDLGAKRGGEHEG